MLSLSRILAPIDFSERCAGAARFAGRLAQQFHSELTLLHVLDSSIYELSPQEQADPAIRGLCGAWRARTENLVADFLAGEFQDLDVRRTVLSGDATEQILHFANVEQTSLIVLPTCGFEPMRRFVLGSVVSKILHAANCPILTGVHTSDAFPNQTRNFRNIVCAVDFCPQSAQALAWALQISKEFQAQLTIAHVTPSSDDGLGAYFNSERRQNWAREIRSDEFEIQARHKIGLMLESAGAKADVVIDSSMDVPKAVCTAASRSGADLMVVGRGSSVGIDRLRTKVDSIVRQSPCPVLSV